MSSFIQEFLNDYGDETTEQVASKLNLDRNLVKQILPALTPVVLNGLKKQKDSNGGAERVDHILNKYGDESALGNISELIGSKLSDANSDVKLGGLLGDGEIDKVESLGSKFNLPAGTLSKIIPAIAPVILASLTKRKNTDAQGISGIASVLDRDGDGSILDDLGGMISKGGLGKKIGVSKENLKGLFSI